MFFVFCFFVSSFWFCFLFFVCGAGLNKGSRPISARSMVQSTGVPDP